MKVRLSITQRELLKLAKEKGFLTLSDFSIAYTSITARKENLDRFIALGYLKESKTMGKFDYSEVENDK